MKLEINMLTGSRMKRVIRHTAVLAWLLVAACSTPTKVTSPNARTNMAYIDFYTDSNMQLSWGVRCTANQSAKARTLFHDLSPVEGNVLRLQVPPGTYWFEVWFNNLTITGPGCFQVQLVNGMVTPVHISLVPVGTVYVYDNRREVINVPLTEYARKRYYEALQFRIGATAEVAQVYKPKEQMRYFSAALDQARPEGTQLNRKREP